MGLYNASQAPAAPARSRNEEIVLTAAREYPSQFKTAIICALEVEFLAISRLFQFATSYTTDDKSDPNIYTIGWFAQRFAVLLWPGRVGELHAGMGVLRLLATFRDIELTLLVGICGAVPKYEEEKKAIYLGDVVIGTQVWRYGHNTRNVQRPDGGIEVELRNRL